MSEEKRDHFRIPTEQEADQRAENGGVRGEQGDGQVDGQQQTEAQEGSRQEVQGGVGEVVEIKGVVVDVRFGEDEIPEIFNALKVEYEAEDGETGEVT